MTRKGKTTMQDYFAMDVKLLIGFLIREKSEAWFLSVNHVDPDKGETLSCFIPSITLHSIVKWEICNQEDQGIFK